MATTTRNIRFIGTNIFDGDVERSVIAGDWHKLRLRMRLRVDDSLFGRGYRFHANFHTIDASTNQGHDTLWNGMLDVEFRHLAPLFWIQMTFERARDAVRGDSGMHIFRPYFVVDANNYTEHLVDPTGDSEFGVGEDHFFWIEEWTPGR